MSTSTAKFHVGQIVLHCLFEYRGVIIDVDPEFHGNEDWYSNVARTRPPKQSPWYHVLVDGGDLRTYVAERNLEPDTSGEPISHPDVIIHFEIMSDGGYISRRKDN